MDDDHTNLYNMMYEHPIFIQLDLFLNETYVLFPTSIVYSFHPAIGNIVQIKAIITAIQEKNTHLITLRKRKDECFFKLKTKLYSNIFSIKWSNNNITSTKTNSTE